MIVYNEPSSHPQRSKVVPPSIEEMNLLIEVLNVTELNPVYEDILQRMIWNYENLEHFHTTHANYRAANKIGRQQTKLDEMFAHIKSAGLMIVDVPRWDEKEHCFKVEVAPK